MNKLISMVALGAFVMAAGCASQTGAGEVDPSLVDEDATEPQQLLTSTNADGTWTADALAPQVHDDGTMAYMSASANFTGPSGKTRRMGVCLLEKTTTTCNTVADCGSAPSYLPTGGFRYCTNLNGTGTKYCAVRNGPPTEYCAGTPALGGARVAPGTYQTAMLETGYGRPHLSYGCFEGCAATDPSSSSTAKVRENMFCIRYPTAPACWE